MLLLSFETKKQSNMGVTVQHHQRPEDENWRIYLYLFQSISEFSIHSLSYLLFVSHIHNLLINQQLF